MPNMWTPLLNISARIYVHIPIGDRTMENLAGNTGKRSCQTSYTPRTDEITDFKATRMENRETQEGTYTDGT
jgi:hypothetical protein